MPDDALVRLAASLEAARQALDEALRLRNSVGITEDQASAGVRQRMAYNLALTRKRERFAKADSFRNAEIFSDPAFDILLDLYIHQSRAEPIAVRTAIVSSSASTATALRWLKVLEKEGLISLPEDVDENGTGQVLLTEDGFESMTSYLCELSAIGFNIR